MKGYIQVYTGNGKGKTTAALGLTLRASGAGKKVLFTQFIKGDDYSEIKAIENYLPSVTVRQYGLGRFISGTPLPEDIEAARKGLAELSETVSSGAYDVIVMDEANVALHHELIDLNEFLQMLRTKADRTEIVITGRYAKPEVVEIADLVTEMCEIKHYYRQGVMAREGIEY